VAEKVIGEGGTAEVLRVRSLRDGKVYALKRIDKRSASRNERFRREIAFGMSATNDHVVKIHAQLEDDRHFYYVMDLYPKSLREVMREESDYEVLLDYLSQICEGLRYLHGEGVVHRDIKPENILVDSENRRLVLADFGIAHFKDSSLTKPGEILANRNYQAPEQMAKRDTARRIGKPADVFALGLIITEMFTKENPRGAWHTRVGHIHPFLSDLDLLVGRMTLQDASQRIGIEAVRDMVRLIRREVDSRIADLVEVLRLDDSPRGQEAEPTDAVLERAAKDVLSAKYIFERASGEALSRYNPNYHCEVGYRVSRELYNTCVQAKLYSLCRSMFMYEAGGGWGASDMDLVTSPTKAELLRELEGIQSEHRLPQDSPWSSLPARAAHYFRFLKDYHCREVVEEARRIVADTGPGSLQSDLLDAPIIWIVRTVRSCLDTDLFTVTQTELERLEFEYQVSVSWDSTCLADSQRTAAGADLFDPRDVNGVAHVLESFTDDWDVSVGQRADGKYSIHFRSTDEYQRFREQALNVAGADDVFRGDVVDLLRPDAQYDDLVALVWEPVFDIPVTVAKVLRLRVT
jgi:serine/threonine-protein kinase